MGRAVNECMHACCTCRCREYAVCRERIYAHTLQCTCSGHVMHMQCTHMQCTCTCACSTHAPEHREAQLGQLERVHLGLPRARALHQEVHAQRRRGIAAAAAQPHEPPRHEGAHLSLRRRHRRAVASRARASTRARDAGRGGGGGGGGAQVWVGGWAICEWLAGKRSWANMVTRNFQFRT